MEVISKINRMTKNSILKTLLIIFLFIFVSGLNDVMAESARDNLENEVKAGFSGGLIDLAALIGYYGINSGIVYTTKANNWRKVQMECSRVTGELEKICKISTKL